MATDTTVTASLPPPRAGRLASVVVPVLWLAGIAMTSISIAGQQIDDSDFAALAASLAGTFATFSTLTAGSVLALRLPRNRIGWLLLGSGFLLALAFVGILADRLSEPAATALAWTAELTWVPAIVGLGLFVPLIFPDGNLPGPRWRLLVAAVSVAVGLTMAQNAFGPGVIAVGTRSVANPLGTSGLFASLLSVGNDLSNIVGVTCLALVVGSVINRYRHAVGVERQQFTWFAAAAGFTAIGFTAALVASSFGGPLADALGAIGWTAALAGFGLLPLAIGIAVLRYRLYNIDVILRRTAVYVPLTAILAGMYAASIAVLQRVFVAITGNESDGAVILATLILATLSTPIKNGLQGWVDRSFRDARGAEVSLAEFVAEVANALYLPAPDRVLRGYLRAVVTSIHASGGAAYAGPPGAERLVAETPGRRPGPTAIVEVGAGAFRLGRLELDARRDGRELNPRDLDAVAASAEQLARSLGPTPPIKPAPERDTRGAHQVRLDIAD